MKKCAFLTLSERGDYIIDDEHAVGPLADIGWEVSTLSWRQTVVPWKDFDAVVIRSTWDYWNDVPAFLETLGRINRETRLANPLDLVHWNLAKTYMQDLEGKGVGIVPTLWPDTLHAESFPSFFDRLDCGELVVKPVVGANGQDAYRIPRGESADRLAAICKRFTSKNCMVQRYLPAVKTEGEYSLFFFAGEFSHAILKVPSAEEFRSQEEHGSDIQLVKAEDLLLRRAREVMATIEPAPLYARIDFVRDPIVRNDPGDFLLMEMELIEPSMYLRTDPQAPRRFARAIDSWF